MTGGPDETLVPESLSDQDSDYESVPESTASLTSSILKYEEQNGRRYHTNSIGAYPLPGDDSEQERLDLTHGLWIETLQGRLALNPGAETANRVLDLGTGTGIWAIEYADDHPSSTVIGVDRMPIQSTWLPPNLMVEIDNIEEAWTWHEPFDFIFSRAMIGSIENWPRLIKESFDNLKPGGYLELQDHCYPMRCDDDTAEYSNILKWSQHIVEACEKTGRTVTVAPKFKALMEEAGFEEVTEKLVKLPINPWAKDKWHKTLGAWTHRSHSDGLEGVSLYLFTQVLKWTKEETLVFLAHVRKDLGNLAIHGYWPAYIVYGRKPKN